MGKTKDLIDELIKKKANGNSFQEHNIKMKLMFKGIYPDNITHDTPDSDDVISKIHEIAGNFNVNLTR